MKSLGLAVAIANFVGRAMAQEEIDVVSSPKLSVAASVLFAVQLDSLDRKWDEYESQLLSAVEILALETISLINNNWNHPEEERPDIEAQLPMALGISKAQNETVCMNCQSIYASATLLVDPTDDPFTAEAAFEGIFNASLGHGHLQQILDDLYPGFFVTVAVPVKDETPTDDYTGNVFGDDDFFFGGPLEQPKSATSTTNDQEEGGLSMLTVLGILGAALLALGVSMIALWVVRQKRCSARDIATGKDPQSKRGRGRRNRRSDLPPVDTDLDLVETFSETGLEWGGSPEGNAGAPLSTRGRTESDVAGFSETISLEDALAPYNLPTQFHMTSTPDSLASARYSTAFSVPTPDSSVANSAMGRYSVDSLASSEMRYNDFEEYHRDTALNPVNMDQLEAAIVSGDWETLAKAAHQNMAASETSSVQSSISYREDWSGRSKDWQKTMDKSKAALLDLLVQDGDWEGILHLAQKNKKVPKKGQA